MALICLVFLSGNPRLWDFNRPFAALHRLEQFVGTCHWWWREPIKIWHGYVQPIVLDLVLEQSGSFVSPRFCTRQLFNNSTDNGIYSPFHERTVVWLMAVMHKLFKRPAVCRLYGMWIFEAHTLINDFSFLF